MVVELDIMIIKPIVVAAAAVMRAKIPMVAMRLRIIRGRILFLCVVLGGGGAPSGNAGVGASAVANSYGGNPGGVATSDSGGAGGDAWRIVGSTSGGGGGATISFSCAGQTLYSYGGGGGGAIQARMSPGLNLDGGAGASGTTGTSESSFVRIYRFG